MKGIKLPIKVNPRGGAVTDEGPSQLRQNVMLGLLPASSLHPWNQKLTPPEDIVFDIADERSGNLLLAHVHSFFRELEAEGLATLAYGKNSVRIDISDRESGQVEVAIQYIDLEDNQSREIRIGPGGI